MSKYVAVAKRSQLIPGTLQCVEVEGRRLALMNVKGQLLALADECPHEGAPLSEGYIEGEELHCPWHDACFNVHSGQATSGPTEDGVARFNVRVQGEDIEVEI